MFKRTANIMILFILMNLTACDNSPNNDILRQSCYISTAEVSEQSDITDIIFDKASEFNGEVLEYEIIDNNQAVAVIKHNDICYDFYYFTEHSIELILSSELNMAECAKHTENETVSLIVYQKIPGAAFPSNIVTWNNGKINIFSVYTDSEEQSEYLGLYYSLEGDIICDRGIGISSGAVNVIPYYWDNVNEQFVPYALHEISIDDLKAIDTENTVEDIDSITSAYIRDNGLIHVNYTKETDNNESTAASHTYVTENGCLRKYDFNADMKYGFFLEELPVTDNCPLPR